MAIILVLAPPTGKVAIAICLFAMLCMLVFCVALAARFFDISRWKSEAGIVVTTLLVCGFGVYVWPKSAVITPVLLDNPLEIQFDAKNYNCLSTSAEQDKFLLADNEPCFKREICLYAINIHNPSPQTIEGIRVEIERIEPDSHDDPHRRKLLLHQTNDGDLRSLVLKENLGTEQKENLNAKFVLGPFGSGREDKGVDVIYSHPWFPETSYIQHIDDKRPNEDVRPGKCTLVIRVSADGYKAFEERFGTDYDPQTRRIKFWRESEPELVSSPNLPSIELPQLTASPLADFSVIAPNSKFGVECDWKNIAAISMQSVYGISRVYTVSLDKDERKQRITEYELGRRFAKTKDVEDLIRQYCSGQIRGEDVPPEKSYTVKSFSDHLSRSDFVSIQEGTKALYVVSWLAWEDSDGKNDWAQSIHRVVYDTDGNPRLQLCKHY